MTSPNISFDSIPSSIRKPGQYFEFNTRLAVSTLPANAQKVLILGPMLLAAVRLRSARSVCSAATRQRSILVMARWRI